MNATNMIHQSVTIGDMRRALITARERTGDRDLSHTVKAGKFQIVRCTMTKKSSVVVPLSGWNSGPDHLAALNALGVS